MDLSRNTRGILSFLITAQTAYQAYSLNTTYVIGDLHGDSQCARYWVTRTNLISSIMEDPKTWHWTGEEGDSLIFVGDYIDKGPQSRQTIELVKNLTERFPDRVTAIMGNHELELLKDRTDGKYGYYYQLAWATVHPGEYLNFIDNPDEIDEMVIDALYNASLEVYGYNFHNYVQFTSSQKPGRLSIIDMVQPPSIRELVSERLDSYQANYINAFRSGTELGNWVEKRPIAHLERGTLFLHGGVSQIVANHIKRGKIDVDELNEKFRTNAHEDQLSGFLDTVSGKVIEEMVFYRGNHKAGACADLEKMIEMMDGVERIGVGHTPEDNVRVLCGGRFLALDSALGRWFRASGNMYCRGEREEVSSNRRFVCDKKIEHCEGQIVKITDGNVEILEPLSDDTDYEEL